MRFRRALAAAVLLAAALAVPAPSALAAGAGERYQVVWVETAREVRYDGRLAEGEEANVPVDVACCNVARVEFSLSWVETDDRLGVSDDDVFRLRMFDPHSVERAGGGRASSAGVILIDSGRVADAPAARIVEAESADGARGAVADVRSAEGAGGWTARITLESTGDASGLESDAGNSYVLAALVTRFEPAVHRIVALEGGGAAHGVAADAALWQYTALGLAGAAAGLGGFIVVTRGRTPRQEAGSRRAEGLRAGAALHPPVPDSP